jgi:hypothetical protein
MADIFKKKLSYCPESIGCFFKFHLEVGVEESIVNGLWITDDGSLV